MSADKKKHKKPHSIKINYSNSCPVRVAMCRVHMKGHLGRQGMKTLPPPSLPGLLPPRPHLHQGQISRHPFPPTRPVTPCYCPRSAAGGPQGAEKEEMRPRKRQGAWDLSFPVKLFFFQEEKFSLIGNLRICWQ